VDDIHSYSRIACGIAALLSNGRLMEYEPLWHKMMEALCNDFHRRTPPTTLDFALKETMLAFKAMKPFIGPEKQRHWLGLLGKIDPFRCFSNVANNQEWEHIRNWNIYAMAGYYLLETEGAADSTELFERHWDHQFRYFDENGMYVDPHAPVLYDLTTRVQAQLIPGYGYKGKFSAQLDDNLKKGALSALFYQSSAFELPFGGRSNQFLFNESLLAANFEYEASRWKREGNMKLAGMYKRAAHKAILSIERWLKADGGARQIKNFYPIESKYGTESYGYYDKYMMTLGCFLFIGYPFADDSIEEFPCPAELGGYMFQTSDVFHKIFANCGSYSIEIDTSADILYDAAGLGRIHRTGAPTELALSASSGELHHTSYETPGCARENMALGPGWENDGEMIFLAGASNRESQSFDYLKNSFGSDAEFIEFTESFRNGLDCKTEVIHETAEGVAFRATYSGPALTGIAGLTESYNLTKDGLQVECLLEGYAGKRIFYMVPAFLTNGKDTSEISICGGALTVRSMGWEYSVETDGKFIETGTIMGNRNGKYKKYVAETKSDRMKVGFRISRIMEEDYESK
ncbi:MAG: hypothetical protein R6W99_01205, partial [Clostridia bacterium]